MPAKEGPAELGGLCGDDNGYEAALAEFTGVSNNEAYQRAFNARVLRRDADGHFVGTDQRSLFLPVLYDAIQRHLPDKHLAVLDVGAGAGEIMDCIGHLFANGATVYIEEPSSLMLQAYVERVALMPNLRLGGAFAEPLQYYYAEQGQKQPSVTADGSRLPGGGGGEAGPGLPPPSLATVRADLVLSIHMLYHLTDPGDGRADPPQDLRRFIRFLYSLLADGGVLFVVYADLERGVAGKVATGYYLEADGGAGAVAAAPTSCGNLAKLYRARNEMFLRTDDGGGAVMDVLSDMATPTTAPRVLARAALPSRFYGRSVADLAVMSLVGELCPADSAPFDVDKLKFALQYLKNPAHARDLEIGIDTDPRSPHYGMHRVNEPQVVCVIQKARTGGSA